MVIIIRIIIILLLLFSASLLLNYFYVSLFFQTDRELNFDVETAIKVKHFVS